MPPRPHLPFLVCALNTVIAAARALGLVEAVAVTGRKFAHLVVLSGLVSACVNRTHRAAELIRGGLAADAVVVLGAHRALGGAEPRQVRDAGLGDLADEAEVIVATTQKAFGLGATLAARECSRHHPSRPQHPQIRRKPVLSGLINEDERAARKPEKAQVQARTLFSSGTGSSTPRAGPSASSSRQPAATAPSRSRPATTSSPPPTCYPTNSASPSKRSTATDLRTSLAEVRCYQHVHRAGLRWVCQRGFRTLMIRPAVPGKAFAERQTFTAVHNIIQCGQEL